VKFSYLPVLHALVALNGHDPLAAIEFLRPAASYELGWQGSASVGFVGSLYPIYVRGMAFLAARRGAQAAIEFQKVLDHRGVVLADPIGALAHLQLGRTYAQSGETAKATAEYQVFLTLWKDADAAIPILQHAKAESARLLSGTHN
jgi:hypothetical protein